MRSTEQLLAAAEERLRLCADLPSRVDGIRGWAVNADQSIRVTTSVHGALVDLFIADEALALGPDRIAAEIVHLAGEATKAALAQGVGELSRALGDSGTAALAEAVGLGQLIEPDATVIPYVPGVDPNADKWTVIEDSGPRRASAQDADDDEALTFDFSRFRSDR